MVGCDETASIMVEIACIKLIIVISRSSSSPCPCSSNFSRNCVARSVTTWTAYGAMCSPWCSIKVSRVWTTSSLPTVCISSKSASVSWGSTDTISSSQHSCSTIAFTASAACTRTGSSRSRTRPMIERTAAWNESAAADLPPAKRSWANWPYTQQHRARRKPCGDASAGKTCACSIEG